MWQNARLSCVIGISGSDVHHPRAVIKLSTTPNQVCIPYSQKREASCYSPQDDRA